MASSTLGERLGVTGDGELQAPRTWLVMVAAAAGAFVGAAILVTWAPSWASEQRRTARSGPFQLWAALIIGQTILWTLATAPLIATFRRHWRARDPDSVRAEVVPALTVLLILLVTLTFLPRLWLTELPDFIPDIRWRITLVTGLALIPVLLASSSIWLIRGRVERLAKLRRLEEEELRTYLELRSDLQWLLGLLGAIIGLAVLASAALRQVVELHARTHETAEIPIAQGIIVYGLLLSLLLALMFLPTWATVQQAGGLLRDEVARLPSPTSDELEERVRKRNVLDELMGLRVSASTSFKGGVAILAPLIGSLATLLPGFGGS